MTQKMVLKGLTVSSGIFRGKVRKIMDPELYKDLRQGEVLVTGMTRPQYNHLYRSAGAVVTDEGGILGHAALVARECKVPFIAGTGNASQVLETGDEVEVDANNGVVNIIKKK
jgi:pyruvate,water dikinase